jgi:hypothetical protein
MDEMMGRARFLGRAAVLGAVTVATLLATGTVGVANAAQAATPTASAAAPARESFILPAGTDTVKVGTGRTQLTVTRSSGVSPNTSIPCTLTVSNPTYYTGSGGSGVQASGVIRCAYPTNVYLEIDLSYNGNITAYNGQSFASTYVASLTVTTSAAPGYYQASDIAILGNGQQYGTYYSSNVYIPQ